MSTKQIAQGLASLGRNGDTMLMHVTPEEVTGLQALAETQGTSLTVNPNTGLPEAFNLGGFFRALLPAAAGAATGGMGAPLMAGILAGSATGALTNRDDPLMGAVTGGLGGFGGYGLGQGLAAAGAKPAISSGLDVSSVAPQESIMNSLTQSGSNFDPLAKEAAMSSIPKGAPGSIASNFIDTSVSGFQGLNDMGQGIKNLTTGQSGSWDAFKQGLAGAGNAPVKDISAITSIGMPVGSALLGGLEESDFMGRPIKTSGADKYDPYATLNLNTDSGLRLYAEGGTINTGGITDLYATSDNQGMPQLSQNGYGMGRLNSMMQGGMPVYAEGGYLNGAGDGMSDDIPATIEGDQPARLADGEFVIPADVVSHIGNGSSKAGAQELYRMMDRIREARTGQKTQGRQIDPNNFLPE